jgi:hypothetical protein
MYNKETLHDFKFSEKYKVSLDWDAWLRMSEMKGRFVYVPKMLSKHRIHKASATTEGIQGNVRQGRFLNLLSYMAKVYCKVLSKFYSGSYKSNEV